MNKFLEIIEFIILIILFIILAIKKTNNDFKFRYFHPVGLLILLFASLVTGLSAKLSGENIKEEIEYMIKENFVRFYDKEKM